MSEACKREPDLQKIILPVVGRYQLIGIIYLLLLSRHIV